MKKLLGISLVAVLTATPLMASAADRVALVTEPITPNTNVASTSYVQGAYNVLGAAINAIDTDLSGNYATKEALTAETNARTAADTALQGDIDTLSATVDTKAATSDLNALGTRVTTAESAITTLNGDATTAGSVAYQIAQSNMALNTAINAKADQTALNQEITDRQTGDTNTLNSAKTYADSLAGNYATAAQGAKADTAVQSVTTGTANGTISVDGTDVAVKGVITDLTGYATESYADQKAAAAQSAAETTAAADATTKANAAEAAAKTYADAKLLTVYTTWNTDAKDTTTLSNPVANPGA